MIKKLLEVQKSNSGKGNYNHDNDSAMNNLALCYQHQAKYTEAETLYKQILKNQKELIGREKLETLENLANLYGMMERLTEAQTLYENIIDIMVSENDPHLVTAMANLAQIYINQSKLTKAEEILKKCFDQLKVTIGLDSPVTLNIMMKLATVLGQQGKTLDAQKLLLECFQRQKTVLGGNIIIYIINVIINVIIIITIIDNHPDTISTVNNLGKCYEGLMDFANAEKMFLVLSSLLSLLRNALTKRKFYMVRTILIPSIQCAT